MLSLKNQIVAFTLMPTLAFADCTKDAMLVFDGSGSMAETGFNLLDEPRIFQAREAVSAAIPPISELRRLGLVVYGSEGEDACNFDLKFAPIEAAAPRILNTINGLVPAGNTALTDAVRLAADVLEGEGEVVLVTDGKETCEGLPCQLASQLAVDDSEIVIHVIGFKVRGDNFSWSDGASGYTDVETVAKCLAEETGGQYVSAETLDQLIAAFWRTLGCALVS